MKNRPVLLEPKLQLYTFDFHFTSPLDSFVWLSVLRWRGVAMYLGDPGDSRTCGERTSCERHDHSHRFRVGEAKSEIMT
ncbi:hypothetical protein M378DRAFT_171391 [Amanita muscaria Koide BX008]|uniref:Uncharacterized protein n=1 Tax=Amanita muscaria (strain Koide BX008) TaxID=946122 RepID=A0A0C2W942_AMAMK|nr:hypothetical protein M378DRAFT_171391 [Amanita muscaria Koide BX008]